MIFKIAFNVVGITAFVSIFYLQWKMFSIALQIRERNKHLIGNEWNGRASMRQYKKLDSIVRDEGSRRLIRDFSNYAKTQIIIIVAGYGLFLIIAFLNNRLNS